ncbi:phosphoglucosamine mutase [Pectinatus brassicae]|uniref:Phosphoglucosamine mutase n=1 Tax=Pectinatus brassicae TaxID=862415 RepID=A0A840UE16_9FIRM|nr:phosphoglucosamine mutase [Pectinatus brassicae]MBB5335961.1 phosphoglucosamine mutase [Pectinatus brassicae]
MSRLFGTDGVRGEANKELTAELAYKLGRAAAIYFGRDHDSFKILIGRDTRISGAMFESALAAGICSAGGKVIITGIIPTPAIAYLAKKHHAKAGIVISASHNPFHDNGIKFFGGDGYKLPDKVEDELAEIVDKISTNDTFTRSVGKNIGTIDYRHDLIHDYIDYVASTCKVSLEGLKIVLDCANGAAYETMPAVLRQLGASLIVINDNPDGININDNCGSTHLEELQKEVLSHKAAIGIAHDGDADRCLCIDEKGRIIDGDHILVACAIAMKKQGRLNNNTVVSTVMANIGFHKVLQENGCHVEVTAVGDRYVLENMLQNNYNLGGEQSGHVIFKDFATTGDGLITALQVLAHMAGNNVKASSIVDAMISYPQLLLNIKVASKDGWENNESIKAAIASGEQELGDNGRILVRPSGTEPLIRVMAEGPNQTQLEDICHSIGDVIKQAQG